MKRDMKDQDVNSLAMEIMEGKSAPTKWDDKKARKVMKEIMRDLKNNSKGEPVVVDPTGLADALMAALKIPFSDKVAAEKAIDLADEFWDMDESRVVPVKEEVSDDREDALADMSIGIDGAVSDLIHFPTTLRGLVDAAQQLMLVSEGKDKERAGKLKDLLEESRVYMLKSYKALEQAQKYFNARM